MRVNRFSSSSVRKKRKTSSPVTRGKAADADFKAQLQTSINNELRSNLNQMLKEIDDQGDAVIRDRTLDQCFKYKTLVKKFLKTIVKNIYHLKENFKFGPRGKQNILFIVENIDKSLEELLNMVLNKEIDNLKLLEKIGEIRGMLIDTYS